MNPRPPLLVFIGGGPLQRAAFGYAKDLGAEVALFDRNPEAACRDLAFKHYTLDGTDKDGILAAVAGLAVERRIAGVYCNNDFGLEAAGAINERFGLPGPLPISVYLCENKDLMVTALRDAGLPVPKGVIVETPADAAPALPFSFPVIAKRTVGSGSVGVFRVDTPDALRSYVGAQPPGGRLLVEQLLEGTHHDVNAYMRNGNLYRAGIADRFFGAAGALLPVSAQVSSLLPVRGEYPTSLEDEVVDEVYWAVGLAARALGIEDCPVKAGVMWTANGPVLLELAPRFHGEIVTAHMVPAATGETPIRDWLSYLVNGRFRASQPTRSGYSAWHAILPPRGQGVPETAMGTAQTTPGVAFLDWRFGRHTGEGPYGSNADVRGLFVTTGASREEARERTRDILASVLAAFSHGNTPPPATRSSQGKRQG